LYKRVADRLVNYSMYFVTFLVPIGTQIMTGLLALAYVAYQKYVEKDSRYTMCEFFRYRSSLASNAENGQFSQWILFMMSFYAQIGNVLTSLPSAYFSVTTQGLLLNLTLFSVAFFAKWMMNAKFNNLHMMALALIVVSSLVSMNREISEGTLGEYKDPHNVTHTSSLIWYGVFIAGTIPMGYSSVLNQKWLQKVDLDVVWSSYWGGYWQLLAAFMTFPMNWVALPYPASHQAPGDTWTYIKHGTTCIMGYAPTASDLDQQCVSEGGGAYMWFGLYLLFCMAFNVLLCWLTKRMSATWATIGSVLCLDLSALLGSMTWLLGSEAAPVTFEQVLGLLIAGLAIVLYSQSDDVDRSDDQTPDEEDHNSSNIFILSSSRRGDMSSSQRDTREERLLASPRMQEPQANLDRLC